MHHRPAATATTAAAKAAAAPSFLLAASSSSSSSSSAAARRRPPTTTTMATAAPATPAPGPIRLPVAETVAGRTFRYVQLPNRVRAVVVHDPAAAFGAVAAVVQAGYLSDGAATAAAAAAAAPAQPPPPAATTTPKEQQPLPLHGLAHFLEHAVHLGSRPFPAEDAYKQHLAKHGGSSNASTSAATTRYHARCAASGLEGAVERLGAALASPLLRAESLAREVDNVHAEYSRNRNSDARRALQLRRASLGPPLSGFSTGSIETLRDAPLRAGVDLPRAMRELWRQAYVGPAVTAAVVGPQPVEELEAWARRAFSGVRASPADEAASEGASEGAGAAADDDAGADAAAAAAAVAVACEEAPKAAAAATAATAAHAPAVAVAGEEALKAAAAATAPPPPPSPPPAQLYHHYATPSVGPPGSGRTLAASCFPRECMARLVRVAPMRELREIELMWHIPYSTLGEPALGAAASGDGDAPATAATSTAAAVASAAVAPWSWAAHVVGHEALGSAAELLKRQGLITSLSAGVGEDVRLSPASPLLRSAVAGGDPPSSSSSPSCFAPAPSHDTGLMTWHVSVDLTAEGDARAAHVAATVHRAVELLRRAPEDEWRRTWEHARQCAELRFEHRDRTEALRLAQGLAASAAHYPARALLSGPSLYEGPFDAGACRAFLDRLATPGALVVTHTSPAHRVKGKEVGGADKDGGSGSSGSSGSKAPRLETEPWYGARYASEPLPEVPWLATMRTYAAVDRQEEEAPSAAAAATTAAAALSLSGPFAPRRGELFLPPAAPWALPHDLALREQARDAAAKHEVAKEEGNDVGGEPPAAATAATSVRRPELVYASPGLHAWHALDAARFGVPKAQFRLRLVTPASYASGPRAAVAARLLARALDDVLEPELYDARVAGSSLDLSPELDGFSLTAAGFSDVLPRLLERALSAARSLSLGQVERRFERLAGGVRRDLLNWRNGNPQAHAEYAAERLLQPGKHHAEELLRELCFGGSGWAGGDVFAVAAAQEEQQEEEEGEGQKKQQQRFAVTPADVLALCRAVFSGGDESLRAPLHVDALLYGNLSRDEAAAVAASLERALAPPGIPPCPAPPAAAAAAAAAPSAAACWPVLPVVDLSSVPREAAAGAPPRLLTVANPNPANANHAMLMVTQLPPPLQASTNAGEGAAADDENDDEQHARQAALLDLFVQASAKACFHELRTVRRLGYSVSLYSASYGGGGRPMEAAAAAPVVVDAAAAAADGDGGANNDDCDADPLRPRPVRHLCIRVQSPSTEPEALASAAAGWLASFRATLAAMPEGDLGSHRAALCARYLEPARSLSDACSRAWRPLRGSRRDFAWRERKARAAAALGRDDLLRFYDAHLDPACSAAMVVLVKGGGGKEKEEKGEEEGARAAGGGGGRLLRPPPLPAARSFGG